MPQKLLPNGFAMNIELHPKLVPMDTVFLHGNLASNTWWQPALDVWAKDKSPANEGRLIFAEWRGCGKSAAPQSEAELHPEALANDYILMLQELGVSKSCVVAHSTGGLIALCAMLKAPELFDRAVLLDPVSGSGVQFEKPMYDAFTQMSQDRQFCELILGGTIRGNDPSRPLFQKIVDDTMNVAKEVWHGVPKALHEINITDRLPCLQQKILILHGEHDSVLPKEKSVELATQLPNAEYRELKDQGHSTNIENPELFVQLVNEFLFHRP